MKRSPTVYDTMAAAYDRAMAGQRARERARARRDSEDRGATPEQTMANVFDRLQPTASGPGQAGPALLAESARGPEAVTPGHAAHANAASPPDAAQGTAAFVPRYNQAFFDEIAEAEQSFDYMANHRNSRDKSGIM